MGFVRSILSFVFNGITEFGCSEGKMDGARATVFGRMTGTTRSHTYMEVSQTVDGREEKSRAPDVRGWEGEWDRERAVRVLKESAALWLCCPMAGSLLTLFPSEFPAWGPEPFRTFRPLLFHCTL